MPQELYEAAAIDGASGWMRFRAIGEHQSDFGSLFAFMFLTSLPILLSSWPPSGTSSGA